MIDLHNHTHYSDGCFSPAEIIQAAAEKGLRAIAISDHDNTRGAREALPLARAAGIELVPAIEITTDWPEAGLLKNDQDVDLLGYFIDLDDPAFHALETTLLADLHERIAETCRRLSGDGIPLTIEDVFRENPRYAGSLHAINALVHLGLAAGWDEGLALFGAYWVESRPSAITIQAAITAIHNAGGAAVLAHPSIVRPNGRMLDASWLRPLVEAGLDGIEVYHFRLDDAAREHFSALSRQFHLVITGGSDTHGWNEGAVRLGREPVSEWMLAALRERAESNR